MLLGCGKRSSYSTATRERLAEQMDRQPASHPVYFEQTQAARSLVMDTAGDAWFSAATKEIKQTDGRVSTLL